MSTVAKVNMCVASNGMSFCTARSIKSQPDCTHHIPHSSAVHCMWYRPDFDGACDNPWAQIKQVMPEGIVALLMKDGR